MPTYVLSYFRVPFKLASGYQEPGFGIPSVSSLTFVKSPLPPKKSKVAKRISKRKNREGAEEEEEEEKTAAV